MGDVPNLIADTEDVARILHRNWVVDGILQHYAFALRCNETYISVNRPAISTYDADVSSFVTKHPDFYANETQSEYMCTLVNVGDIRKTKVTFEDFTLNIDVEVEPRDVHVKSHAGIFSRHAGKNIKNGEILKFDDLREEVSSDEILLEVRSLLIEHARLERRKLKP